MSVTSKLRPVLAAVLAAGICVAPPTAAAQSRLPWGDANPLEKWFGKPGEKRRPAARARNRPAAQAAPAVPAIAAVPVPDARPSDGDAPSGQAAADAASLQAPVPKTPDAAAPDAPATVKSADTDPEVLPSEGEAAKPLNGPERKPATKDGGQDGTVEAAAPGAEAPDASDAASPAEPTPGAADALPDAAAEAVPAAPADPAATAEKPVTEIPVPEVRPADAPAPAPDIPPLVPAVPALEDGPNATEKLKARAPDISPATAVIAAAAIEDAELCEAELKKRGVEFTVGPSISEGDCGVLRPVNVSRLSSGVEMSPDTQFLCRTALALDTWMTDSVVPAAKAALPNDRLTEFRHASTYVCRPRASENGISEHARGSAIDIAAFVFDKRPEIGIEAHAAGSPEARFQDAMREGACGPFKTVLGPGTDADHATHFHLDIAARKNGSTYCK